MDLILKNGSTGHAVVELQNLLNTHGLCVTVDGWFGDDTERAVEALQSRAGLVIDGIAGCKTLAALRGKPSISRLLHDADLIAAAEQLGVELASIKAVNAVESRGTGFLPDGRPVILLERHVAYRRAASAGHDADMLAHRYPNLINAKRGGYIGGADEYSRFENLRSCVGHTLALESCSWGLFQIMGYHWQDLGYASATAFHDAMKASEAAQLDAFVRFIKADAELHKALKAKKWAEFARRYNGPAYKENLYDQKLAAAYARFAEKAEKAAA